MNEWLEKLRGSFENLKPGERLLVSIAGALLVLVLLFFGIVYPILSAASRAEESAHEAENTLQAVLQLRAEYDEVNSRVSRVDSRIASGPSGNLFTQLESLAQQSALKIDSLEPQPSPENDRYRETKVEVVLKSVTLAQLVTYMHKIETSQQLLSVKSLRIRTRSDSPDLLDATFSVSSFERL